MVEKRIKMNDFDRKFKFKNRKVKFFDQIVNIDLVYIRLVKHTIDVGSMKVYLTVG